MAQYIDKNTLVEELERLYNLEYANTSNLSCGKKIMLRNILHFLDTLEVKEVHSTDTLIEKAEEFIYSALNDGIMGTANIEDFMRLFKKYMKEE